MAGAWRRPARMALPSLFFPSAWSEVMKEVERVNVEKRLSDMAIFNGVAYLAGQVPDDSSLDIQGQTTQVLHTIDRLLATAGTDKSRILMAQIFLANMKEFDGMNKAWDAWVAAGNAPPRASVEAGLPMAY
jgi:enamine deaminase RidA (YjgF/YER057c/UK114 family)